MALVLATGAPTESGHRYADDLGVVDEYPNRYRRAIVMGDVFVYYRGRRTPAGGRREQVYLGSGVIGETGPSSSDGLMICAIEDFRPFSTPVPFRTPNGTYLEPGGVRRGYFQPGVRHVPIEVWEGIVSLGAAEAPEQQTETSPGAYATAAEARAIETISRLAVVRDLEKRGDVRRVTPMTLNSPGYDLRADTDGGDLFVEVKGTRSHRPRFFLTESERLFALANARRYLLAVVRGIDIAICTFEAIDYLTDAPGPENSNLRAHQWAGELTASRNLAPGLEERAKSTSQLSEYS